MKMFRYYKKCRINRLRSNLSTVYRKSVKRALFVLLGWTQALSAFGLTKELLTTLFPGTVALFISESCGGLLKIVEIGPENWRNLTLDDLCELNFELI